MVSAVASGASGRHTGTSRAGRGLRGGRSQAMTSDAHASGLTEFARAWARAVAGTTYVPMTRDERHDFLQAQARRLANALIAEPFYESVGYEVGTALVERDL